MIHVSEEFEFALHLLNSKDPHSASELHQQLIHENAQTWVNGTDHNGTPLAHIALQVDAGYRKLCILVACQPHLFEEPHNGRCPLHIALEHLGKGDVPAPLTKLIDLFPLSLQVPDLDRRLPLHILLEAMPSHNKKFADATNHMQKLVDVAKHMLRVFPDAASVRHVGRTALILCINNELPSSLSLAVLDAHRSAAGVHDEDGKLPLQNALEVGSDHKLVSAIIKAHPAALHRRMTWLGHHCLPLEYAICRKASPAILDALMCKESMGRVGPWIAAYARAAVTGMHYRHRPDSQELLTLESGEPPSPFSPLMTFAKRKVTRPEETTYYCLFVICVLSMRIYSFELRACNTIRDLKNVLASLLETPLELLRLTKDTEDGQVLIDSHTLLTAGLDSGSQIFLHERHTLLHSAIKANVDKDFLLQILRLKPGAAREEDSHNERPFTIALKQQCGTPILLELLKLAPGSVRDTIMGTTGVEYTLQYALRSKADVSVISALIESTSLDDWSAAGQYIPKRSRRLSVGSLREETWMKDTLLPLHIALQSGSVEAVYRLLDHGCPVDARCPQTGQNALECAIVNNHTETMVMYLLRLLVDARETGKDELLRETGSGGQLLLHVAMKSNVTPSLVQQLCTIAPDTLETQDYRGRLPLHMAVTNGTTRSVVRKLLEFCPGAAVKVDHHGYTPLLLAIKHHAPAGVVTELITTDRRVLDARSLRGETPLELAACSDAPPWIVDELLLGCVDDIESISLLNGKWPNTRATMDIISKVRKIHERSRIENIAVPRNLTLLPHSRLWTQVEFTKRSLHSMQMSLAGTASPLGDDVNDTERDTRENGSVDDDAMPHSPHACVSSTAPDQENSPRPRSVQFSPIHEVHGGALANFFEHYNNVTSSQGDNLGSGAALDLVDSPCQPLDHFSAIRDMDRDAFEDDSLDDVIVPGYPGDTLGSAAWELDDSPCEPSVHASTIHSPGFNSSEASDNRALATHAISKRYIYL